MALLLRIFSYCFSAGVVHKALNIVKSNVLIVFLILNVKSDLSQASVALCDEKVTIYKDSFLNH